MNHETTSGVFERVGQDQHKKRRLTEIGQTGLIEPLRQSRRSAEFTHPAVSPPTRDSSISLRIGTIAGCLSRLSSFSSRSKAGVLRARQIS